ncbi:conjugative transfer system coupling protein TraD, partial [Neisseria gonorrhoeae]
YGRITEVATRIANQLPSEGQSAAFRDFVWRFVNVLTKTMEGLSIKPSYENIYKSAANVDELAGDYFKKILDKHHPGWEKDFDNFDMPESEAKSAVKTGRNLDTMKLGSFLKAKKHNEPLIDALGGILSNDRSYFEKLVSSLYPLLEKLTTGEVAKLISPDTEDLSDPRIIMDWRKVMESNAVVYIGLDSLSDAEVAAAVGNAMFADLTSLAGQIYKFGHGVGQSGKTQKRKVSIHADEFNELIGDEFIPLLNKAGGAGYQVTVYTQTWKDVEAKIGFPAKAGQIGGNLNTMIMLRVKTVETAEMLTNQLPEVKIMTSTLVSRAGDVAFPDSHEDFSSGNEDRIGAETVPMLTPADLTQLPKGQAFALIEGGQLYKIRLPLPKKDKQEEIPAHIGEMAADMREVYRLSRP